jgi:predicted AAA+ superfamily ATPase
MNVKEINTALGAGRLDLPGLFPHVENLQDAPYIFTPDFGLAGLPAEPGLILIFGPRQYGKSTWIESRLKDTILEHGPGSAYYLNGDELKNGEALMAAVRELNPLYSPGRQLHFLFIDEITAIKDWVHGLKRLFDAGELKGKLVVATGSKAADLRHGAERLPGRKGKLARNHYYFTPLPFAEFMRVCGHKITNPAAVYALSGGCPAACGEMAANGRLPEYLVEMVRDWILGEFAASGRQRQSLLAVMQCLYRYGGTALGQAKLSRESGLANNTVAAGYLELLSDLLCLGYGHFWDHSRRIRLLRRPAKYHFINLLAAAAYHPQKPRTVAGIRGFSGQAAGQWAEWAVAQEIWRRRAVQGADIPENLAYWQGGEHEIDFILPEEKLCIEVKNGSASPVDFAWFPKIFPGSRLLVICQNRFKAQSITGITMEDFLLGRDTAG